MPDEHGSGKRESELLRIPDGRWTAAHFRRGIPRDRFLDPTPAKGNA